MTIGHPKPKKRKKSRPKYDDPKYIAHIKTLPCAVCGSGPCEPAHQRSTGEAGTGMKPKDKWALPNCRDCHDVEHNKSVIVLWATRGRRIFKGKHAVRCFLVELCEKSYKKYMELK